MGKEQQLDTSVSTKYIIGHYNVLKTIHTGSSLFSKLRAETSSLSHCLWFQTTTVHFWKCSSVYPLYRAGSTLLLSTWETKSYATFRGTTVWRGKRPNNATTRNIHSLLRRQRGTSQIYIDNYKELVNFT